MDESSGKTRWVASRIDRNRPRDGDFEHLRSILDDVLADLEAAVVRTGGFGGDVLPVQRPLSVAIDRIHAAQPEAGA